MKYKYMFSSAIALVAAAMVAGPQAAYAGDECLLDTTEDDVATIDDTDGNADAPGEGSLACGVNAVASGDLSLALGQNSVASGLSSIAIGEGAQARERQGRGARAHHGLHARGR